MNMIKYHGNIELGSLYHRSTTDMTTEYSPPGKERYQDKVDKHCVIERRVTLGVHFYIKKVYITLAVHQTKAT